MKYGIFSFLLFTIAAFLPSGLRGQDTIAYLYLDYNTQISINGVSQLDREKHFNYHEGSMDFEYSYLRDSLDVHVGRSNGEISYHLLQQTREKQGSPGTPDWIRLKGYAESLLKNDLASTVMQELVSDHQLIAAHPEHFMPNLLNPTEYPFMPPANINLAAELLMNYMEWRYPETNRRFRYVEPYNEPNVHLSELGVSWDKVIDYHNVIADSVHQRFKGKILSGGSGSAWPAFQRNDFDIYSNGFGRFIDRAGRKMDFLSIHLYDTHHDQAGLTTLYRLGGNTRAILNLIENHSNNLLGEVKPFVISEYGGGFKNGYSSFDQGMPYHPFMNWFTMKGVNGKLMDYLGRPDRMLKTIPFITGKGTWFYNNENNPDNNPYPWVLVLPTNPTRTAWKFSHNIKFFEFWRGVSGYRIETMSTHPDVQVQAFRDGKQLYWIINNLIDSTIQLGLTIKNDNLLSAASIRRLYMRVDSVPVLQETIIDLSDSIQLKPSEIICLLAEAPDSSYDQEKNWKRIYGKQNLLPITGETVVEIEFQSLPADPVLADTAFIEFSYGRLNDKAKFPSTILFNGDTLPVPDNWAGPPFENQIDFFSSLRVGIMPESIKFAEPNTLSLIFPDDGGRIGSVNMDIRYVTPLTAVSFNTYFSDGDVIGSLANAQIRIADMTTRSGSEGNKTIRIAEGKYEYRILKEGYVTVVDSLVVGEDPLMLFDTLEFIRSNVELRVIDNQTSAPLKNANITWSGVEMTADSNGRVDITGVSYGRHSVTVSVPDYQSIENELLEITTDTLITLKLSRRIYEFGIILLDERTNEPLSNASITSGSTTRITDGDGFARFLLISGDYQFRIEKDKFLMLLDTFSVHSDTVLELKMKQYMANIKFSVSSGNSSIGNATVKLNDTTATTSNIGLVLFKGMRTDSMYIFSVSGVDFEPYSGSFYLYTDTTIIVKLHATQVENMQGRSGIKLYPNPAGNRIWIEGNAEGIRILHLFDSRGIELRKIKFEGGRMSIDMSQLEQGLYYLFDPEKSSAIMIIKQ
ncbi:hypothetical protein ACFLTA_04620 [Bacteroidota bacterium]